MNDQIIISYANKKDKNFALTLHLRKCILAAVRCEGVNVPVEVNVLVTDNSGIRQINRAGRGIDRPTDVLSFPAFEFTPGKLPEDLSGYLDEETGLLPLGDMAISLEQARKQAAEFGHSVRREVGYLTVHSVLHLLGYDHVDEGPMKRQMRGREEAILAEIVLPR